MKNNLFLIIFICFANNLFAQFDTITAIYDFNSLATGNLGGQDNWITTKWNTNIDIQVADTGYDGTKAIYFNQVGPGVGCDASKELETVGFPGFSFTPNGTYILSFDIKRNYWALSLGFASDINNDGKITNTDANEKALILTCSNQTGLGERILLPNGTTLTYNVGGNAWTTYEITLSQMNTVAGGRVGIRLKQLGDSTWTVVASNLNAGIDTTVATKQNPYFWNMLYMHHEGATGYIDNIHITKITPSSATGISSHDNENSTLIYPNPAVNHLTIDLGSYNKKVEITIADITGKIIYSTTASDPNSYREQKIEVNTKDFKDGIYIVQIQSADFIAMKKLVVEK